MAREHPRGLKVELPFIFISFIDYIPFYMVLHELHRDIIYRPLNKPIKNDYAGKKIVRRDTLRGRDMLSV